MYMNELMTVLEKTEILERKINTVNGTIAVIVAICAFVWITAFYSRALSKIRKSYAHAGVCGFLVLLASAYLIAGLGYEDVGTGRYRYKITVDDKDFKRVYNNYNIVEECNGYYIIEDKENK